MSWRAAFTPLRGSKLLNRWKLKRRERRAPIARFKEPSQPFVGSAGWLLAFALLAASAAGAGECWTNSLQMKFIHLFAGAFTMGSPVTEKDRAVNETQHPVKITKPFWLAATPVTVGQFAAFARAGSYQTAAEKEGWAYGAWNPRENRWNRLENRSWKNPGFLQDTNHPVVCVTWLDATNFCRWLGVKEDRFYRLPTEAEWEYACRAGTTTAYPWGDNPDDGEGWANGSDHTAAGYFTLFPPFSWSDGYIYTSPVATFRPNAWGLYDMIGNTLQWCGDWYAAYPAGLAEDPAGPEEGKERVLRGGAFVYGPRHCRCAFRGRNSPEFRNFYVGFRVLLEDK
jgi:formylglycine-generating enzyme required for sulfatase activity